MHKTRGAHKKIGRAVTLAIVGKIAEKQSVGVYL